MESDSSSSPTESDRLRRVTLGALPEWGVKHGLELLDLIGLPENGFPCTFAVRGARTEGLRFGFIDELYDRDAREGLRVILRQYLAMYQSISRETSLIVFFHTDEPDDSLSGYFGTFWEILQDLHDGDTTGWPAGIPQNIDHPMWEYVFEGTPMFVVCSTPAHVRRRSRHSPIFYITFQPQWVFENIKPDTRAGQLARKSIRKRLVAFDDGLEPSAALGNYGDPDNREWLQYFLPDDNESGSPTGGCPFLHRARPPLSD
ncbi:YqcI/YcgG family protein [Nocardia alni]|uniref:YqcI/YcgG family protein n=1 Tax=Nocardia alni TaxID=2815723 RepID=UPI001C21576A|nr:YqcI/YcgG family protein [Nocardia alni]